MPSIQFLPEIKAETPYILLDFHAEATSEKIAMGWHADGRVSAVIGTHTHVPTADARVLPQGTAYITDVGMTGPLRFGYRDTGGPRAPTIPDHDADTFLCR